MKPAPIMPTRIGLPCSSRAWRALSTMIMTFPRPASNGHPSLQLRLDVCQELPAVVLRRDFGDGKRPFQAEPGIVVHQPALRARRIELAHLVARLRPVLEDLVPVREPLGHIQTTVVVGRELNGDVVEIGGALRPQVYDDVEDGSPGAPHEFGLGRGRELEVHPAHRALLLIESNIGLGDERLEPVLSELSLAEDPGKEAPVVLAAIHVEDEGALELRLDEDHDMVPSLGENMRRYSKEAGGDRPRRTHGRKSAVTALALVMITVQVVPEAVSQPVQPVKMERRPVGVAVRVTTVPLL